MSALVVARGAWRYYVPLVATRNLADPDWEPSDEDFAELLRHAADDVAEVRAEVARRLEATIAAARKPASTSGE